MRVPDVPVPLPDPLERVWPAGDPIVRCHHIAMGATEFNTSNASRRFRPVTHGGATVPTLYGADLVPSKKEQQARRATEEESDG